MIDKKPIKMKCDKGCGEEFTITGMETERVVSKGSRSLDTGIDWVGFHCPLCGQKYTAYYINEKVRQLQAEQRELLRLSDPRKLSEKKLTESIEKIKKKKKEIKQEFDRLREEVEK